VEVEALGFIRGLSFDFESIETMRSASLVSRSGSGRIRVYHTSFGFENIEIMRSASLCK